MAFQSQVCLGRALRYIALTPVERAIGRVIIHHTWRPTAAQYVGLSTVEAVRRYHVNERGWTDNGYHFMIGPPGDVFICRPLGNEGAHCYGENADSVGISYIANFDEEDPGAHGGLVVGQRLVAALLRRFGLGVEAVRFHREFATKSCPGVLLESAAYRMGVAELL